MNTTTLSGFDESGAPALSLALLEPLRAVHDTLKRVSRKVSLPFKAPRTVIVYPGLATNKFATHTLRQSLSELGHSVHDWGRGFNTGPDGHLHDWLDPLADDIKRLAKKSRRRVALVGWSLGGIYARELAKKVPEHVSQVVTLGSPFSDLTATNVGPVFELLNRDRCPLVPELLEKLQDPPSVPTTSVYSRTDGIVAWHACRLPEAAHTENIEVNDASHLGLVAHPGVAHIVADRLAQSPRSWKRYRAA